MSTDALRGRNERPRNDDLSLFSSPSGLLGISIVAGRNELGKQSRYLDIEEAEHDPGGACYAPTSRHL